MKDNLFYSAVLILWFVFVASVCVVWAQSEEIADPAPVENFQTEAVVEDYENPYEDMLIEQALLAQATKIEDCTITYYCAEKFKHICGWGLGITATGAECVPYTMVAVDTSVIPLHSQVLVDYGNGEIYCYIAEDVGGAIKGNHIDVMVATHAEALSLGKHTADVYFIPPEED